MSSSNGHIDVNASSASSGKTEPSYATLATSSRAPGVPTQVLNPKDPPYRRHQLAADSGRLNPNQGRVPGGYYSISSAYGTEPIRLYTTRSCSGSNVM